jgi:hypothetical protein
MAAAADHCVLDVFNAMSNAQSDLGHAGVYDTFVEHCEPVSIHTR